MKYNFNQTVKIKLTELGYLKLIFWFNNKITISDIKKIEDENGYYEIQLILLLEIFGGETIIPEEGKYFDYNFLLVS